MPILEFNKLSGDDTALSGLLHVYWAACWCSVCNYSFPVTNFPQRCTVKPWNILNFTKLLINHYYEQRSLQNILGAFETLQKATISSVMHVRLSVRKEQLGSHLTDFHEV